MSTDENQTINRLTNMDAERTRLHQNHGSPETPLPVALSCKVTPMITVNNLLLDTHTIGGSKTPKEFVQIDKCEPIEWDQTLSNATCDDHVAFSQRTLAGCMIERVRQKYRYHASLVPHVSAYQEYDGVAALCKTSETTKHRQHWTIRWIAENPCGSGAHPLR